MTHNISGQIIRFQLGGRKGARLTAFHAQIGDIPGAQIKVTARPADKVFITIEEVLGGAPSLNRELKRVMGGPP